MFYPDRAPVLLVGATSEPAHLAHAFTSLADSLGADLIPVWTVERIEDVLSTYREHPDLAAVVIAAPSPEILTSGRFATVQTVLESLRCLNEHLPLFMMTERDDVAAIPAEVHAALTGCVWVGEDEPDFVAAHIVSAIKHYHELLIPPFFQRLVEYVDESRYSWHTPGHMGGVAYLKSPIGKLFHDFFGQNTLRSDLSSSVPELGSVLEHEGVVADAEAAAAVAYGADQTYFVTNGTTMSNQIVFRAVVSPGDVVLLDRNCHKSIVNSVIQTGAIPIYLEPTRNAYGMIGPVPPSELSLGCIERKLVEHPLIRDAGRPIRLAVLTNSTYDGTLYDVDAVIDLLEGRVDNILFDEAWIPYAPFHPVYRGRYGLSSTRRPDGPTLFSTTSTHKMLAAFSQASMLHVRQGAAPINRGHINEAFMMHASTSPQYSIVASLDVATAMMSGPGGKALVADAVGHALAFRKEIAQVGADLPSADWWFTPWERTGQPPTHWPRGGRSDDALGQENWLMSPDWAGFPDLPPTWSMLDPTKVTLLCPGILPSGRPAQRGIPAALVAAFLRERGIVVEKTGFYSVLFLFSIGTTKGKVATLVEQLMRFKRRFEENAPLQEVLPQLVREHHDRYRGVGVADLAGEMHRMLASTDTAAMQRAIYRRLPSVDVSPAAAFDALIRDQVEDVPVEKIDGRTAAVLCVLYPPGIPVVMPGERFDLDVHPIVDYLGLFQRWDNAFPGFETEMQGVVKQHDAHGVSYLVPCLKQ